MIKKIKNLIETLLLALGRSIAWIQNQNDSLRSRMLTRGSKIEKEE